MFLSSCTMGMSNAHGIALGFNGDGKNGRCACPSVAGMWLKLELG